jgi:hypothetical protein
MAQPLVTWRLCTLGCLHEAAKAARGGCASTHTPEAMDHSGSQSTVVLLLDLPPVFAQHALDELEYGMREGFIPYAMVSSVWSDQEPWEGWGGADTAEVERAVRHAHATRFALDVPLHTAPTEWDPAAATVTLNLQVSMSEYNAPCDMSSPNFHQATKMPCGGCRALRWNGRKRWLRNLSRGGCWNARHAAGRRARALRVSVISFRFVCIPTFCHRSSTASFQCWVPALTRLHIKGRLPTGLGLADPVDMLC